MSNPIPWHRISVDSGRLFRLTFCHFFCTKHSDHVKLHLHPYVHALHSFIPLIFTKHSLNIHQCALKLQRYSSEQNSQSQVSIVLGYPVRGKRQRVSDNIGKLNVPFYYTLSSNPRLLHNVRAIFRTLVCIYNILMHFHMYNFIHRNIWLIHINTTCKISWNFLILSNNMSERYCTSE